MTYIAFIAVAFLLWRCGITLYNYFSCPYLVVDNNVVTTPLVAILIPARNEAHNIYNTLTALVACQYPHYKLFVLDDNSTDDTLCILRAFQQGHPNLDMTILQGSNLPPNWLGKNWACHQLAQTALVTNPDFLLFLDADVLPKKQLIEASVQTSLHHKIVLLSLFPDQIMQTLGEKIVVPIMHYLLLTLLPLRWVEQLPFSSMAAANGQFMFFDAKVYQQYLWHEKVKNKITEDIEIVKVIKSYNFKAMTLLAKGLIYCRMYLNGSEAVKGFSKNFLAGFGNSIIALLLYCFLTTLAYVAVFYEWRLVGLIACFIVICIIDICTALLSQQNIFTTIVLHIPKTLALCTIAIRSIYVKLAGKNTWKGRKID